MIQGDFVATAGSVEKSLINHADASGAMRHEVVSLLIRTDAAGGATLECPFVSGWIRGVVIQPGTGPDQPSDLFALRVNGWCGLAAFVAYENLALSNTATTDDALPATGASDMPPSPNTQTSAGWALVSGRLQVVITDAGDSKLVALTMVLRLQ